MGNHIVVNNGDHWLVDGKYQVLKNGVIYYDHSYVGKRKDFPQWLFKLRDQMVKLRNRIMKKEAE